jgi:hypothetical protein
MSALLVAEELIFFTPVCTAPLKGERVTIELNQAIRQVTNFS